MGNPMIGPPWRPPQPHLRFLQENPERALPMLDRTMLVSQIAKAIAGQDAASDEAPDELRKHADAALSRVELYLGVDIEQAKDIVTKVIEDFS
jgi:hypothetical protein